MHQMLIVESSEALQLSLHSAMVGQYEITLCSDGETGLKMLNEQKPYILLLDLDLPLLDGLELLRRSDYLPPVILVIGSFLSGYSAQCLHDLGVGHFLYSSTPAANISCHVARLVKWRTLPDPFAGDPQLLTSRHLQILRIPVHRDGYRQLKVCIPLFAQDPTQNLTKEVFREAASLLGYDNEKQIERSVRGVIRDAWEVRDPRIWEEYFPPNGLGETHCPECKEFISRLAEILIESVK